MAKPPKLPETERSLPIALMRARENIMGPIRRMLSDTGVTEQQWRVLRVLAESSPMDASHVAERACLLLSSLTRIARGMADKGLIRTAQDPRDRRRQMLEITESGQKMIDDNHAHAAQIVEGFKARLGNEDYEYLLDLLATLAADEPPKR